MWDGRKLRPVWCLLFTLPTAAVWQKKFIFKVFHSHSSTVGVVLLEGVRTTVNLEIYISDDFKYIHTSFPYFEVKLSCVCLMIAYRKKLPKVTQR